MKLDYAALISPYPFYIEGVGGINSPVLKQIWSPKITYQGYKMFLTLLLMTPEAFCKQADLSRLTWYESLSDDERMKINMMDIISTDDSLQKSYSNMFDFFFEENVIWDNEYNLFITYESTDSNGQIIPKGLIHHDIFAELCDIILQRCGITRNNADTDISKVKSKRALEIMDKLKKRRPKHSNSSEHDEDIELPNLIASVAVKSNSVNFTNIWDLTVFQLYEQFKKEQTNVYFDIQKMSVAAYGNEKKTFKGDEWYKCEKKI